MVKINNLEIKSLKKRKTSKIQQIQLIIQIIIKIKIMDKIIQIICKMFKAIKVIMEAMNKIKGIINLILTLKIIKEDNRKIKQEMMKQMTKIL